MAKFLYSFNWCIDTRIKTCYQSKPLYSFAPVKTEHGTITAVDNPYDSYTRGLTAMLRIALNEECIARILDGMELRTCMVEEINLYAGFCGMLTIEIFGSAGDTAANDFKERYNSDMISFATQLPSSTESIADVLAPLTDYTDKTEGYLWGQPEVLPKSGLTDASESYIYTYNLFTDSESEAASLLDTFGINGNSLNIGNNKVWQAFANYIWLTGSKTDSGTAHELNFTYIPAAWEVLIYDSGTICCKNFLRSITDDRLVKPAVIRDMISRDNLMLLEVELSEREQDYEKHLLTQRSKKEYGSEQRKSSFVNSQEMIKYAINGMESKKQQYISHFTGVILAFLTALSVYSVFSDIYALITSSEKTIHFNSISTMMLSAATVIMIAVLYLTTRKEK